MTTTIPAQATREIFGKTLVTLGKENPNVVVLGGDLNKSTFTTLFAKEYPTRFFDFGAAEQNILAAAAGFASSGKIPFASTFAVFGTGRAFDQIRVSIAQPHLNVKLVCTHAGLGVGEDGVSAQAIEDVALMCALPGMTVISPADGPEAAQAVRAAAAHHGPVYIRLYRQATPVLHTSDSYKFVLGKAEELRPGNDVAILATGTMVPVALVAADLLHQEGVAARVINVATLQPLDEEAIVRAARETKALVTAEDHYINGGLGSLVAQALARRQPAPLEVLGVTRYAESGAPAQLYEKYGLTAKDIAAAAKRAIARKKGA